MRSASLPVVAAGLLAASSFVLPAGEAAVVTVAPDNVNRIVGGGFGNTHFDDLFSVDPSATQKTLVKTTGATFLSALEAALGPATPDGYQINSATLVVNSLVTSGEPAHRMLRDWDGADITYNDPDPNNSLIATPWGIAGGQAGTDFDVAPVTIGTVVANSRTEFRDLGPLVQSWIDGDVSNFGLYFPTFTSTGSLSTSALNVSWQVDAVVPEPASLGLLAIAGAALVVRRRARD